MHDDSLQVFEDFLGGFSCRCRAPQVGRAQALGQRSLDGRFYRRRLGLHARVRGGASARRRGSSRAGWPGRCRRCRGPSRARARTGRGRRPRGRRSGSIPIEPVSIAASSLRMSPNMFSVRITSKWRGAAISCIAALSTSRCSSSTLGNSLGVEVADDLAPEPARLEHVGLVDAGDSRPRGLEAPRARSARSPPACRRSRPRRGPRSGSSRRSRSRRSARAPRSGRCRSISSRLSGLASYSAGIGLTGRRLANRPRPLRKPRRPCSGRGLSGSVVSHLGPPTAASSTASAARHASSVSSVRAVPWASIEAPPNRCSSYSSSAPTAFEDLDRGFDDLGADPVAGQKDYMLGHGGEGRYQRACRSGRPRVAAGLRAADVDRGRVQPRGQSLG